MELQYDPLKDHISHLVSKASVDSKMKVDFWDSPLIGEQKSEVQLFCPLLPPYLSPASCLEGRCLAKALATVLNREVNSKMGTTC